MHGGDSPRRAAGDEFSHGSECPPSRGPFAADLGASVTAGFQTDSPRRATAPLAADALALLREHKTGAVVTVLSLFSRDRAASCEMLR